MAREMQGGIIRGCTTVFLLAASAVCPVWKLQAAQAPEPVNPVSATEDKRSSKQKLLEDDADRLVAMATQLKAEVDKTNKNILSLHVVQKAEEIEALAHRMKGQVKR